jgi:hypothetical protein
MPANKKKVIVNKFPLRLMPSIRRAAEDFSQKEGVSLNQFINVAVAEKLAHLQYEEWLARRPKASSDSIAKALLILDRTTGHLDKLSKGKVSARRKDSGKKVPGMMTPSS